MNTQVAPVLVSRTEAARMLGASRETIRRLVARGTLEEVRLEPHMHPRYRVEDLMALARGEREQAP
jgi:excisionase family DNA binding protein